MTFIQLTGKNGSSVLLNPDLICCVDVLPNHQGCAIFFSGFNIQVVNPRDEVVALLGATMVKTR
jgi:uncharacterized protein YlzI (FlbEa/FlbD family)